MIVANCFEDKNHVRFTSKYRHIQVDSCVDVAVRAGQQSLKRTGRGSSSPAALSHFKRLIAL